MPILFLLQVVGNIKNPLPGVGDVQSGLVVLINNVLRLVFIGAGLYALVAIFIAGYKYTNSAGNPESIQEAWAKIWQSFLGLVVIIGTFIFAGLVGQVFFGDAGYLLKPTIPEFGN